MNWISDQLTRMLRTIREVADEAKDAIPTAEDVKEMWRRIRSALNRALEPHPDARVAVLRELEAEFVRQTG